MDSEIAFQLILPLLLSHRQYYTLLRLQTNYKQKPEFCQYTNLELLPTDSFTHAEFVDLCLLVSYNVGTLEWCAILAKEILTSRDFLVK